MLPQDIGYYGSLSIFVDSTGNGQLDRRGRREAFRSFWLGGNVAIDERMQVETPTVDLGSLAMGFGYTPIAPGAAINDGFTPWDPAASYWNSWNNGTFTVRNLGNTNMLNVRMAKAVNQAGAIQSWGLFAPANHENSWMDTMWSMWSDLDEIYALPIGGANDVLLQKARVGDRSGTVLLTNPTKRDNPFLGVLGNQPYLVGTPQKEPRVAVSVPIGTPVGTYVTTITVVEDYDFDESVRLDATRSPLEPTSDPGFTLRFNVR